MREEQAEMDFTFKNMKKMIIVWALSMIWPQTNLITTKLMIKSHGFQIGLTLDLAYLRHQVHLLSPKAPQTRPHHWTIPLTLLYSKVSEAGPHPKRLAVS